MLGEAQGAAKFMQLRACRSISSSECMSWRITRHLHMCRHFLMSGLPLMLEEAQFAAEFMEMYLTTEQVAASAPRPPQLQLSPQPGKVQQTSAWFCCALLCSRWSSTMEAEPEAGAKLRRLRHRSSSCGLSPAMCAISSAERRFLTGHVLEASRNLAGSRLYLPVLLRRGAPKRLLRASGVGRAAGMKMHLFINYGFRVQGLGFNKMPGFLTKVPQQLCLMHATE